MVQLFVDPTWSQNGPASRGTAGGRDIGSEMVDSKYMSRDEYAQRMRELTVKRGLMRAPKRGWSMTDYPGDNNTTQFLLSASSQFDRQAPIPENGPLPSTITQANVEFPAIKEPPQAGTGRRPVLPPPRRSYSVMDYEPPTPGLPKPSIRLTLLDLPSELHFTLFDFLDPIDSVCLGLTNSHFYAIHRRMHGTVPLSTRYSGPNDMEWAWRGAGPLLHPHNQSAAANEQALKEMRVKGQVYCRKCGISRCELHRHLKDWIGEGYEYCSVKDVFGKPAGEDAKPYCHLSSPKNPHRCGRHGGKKKTN